MLTCIEITVSLQSQQSKLYHIAVSCTVCVLDSFSFCPNHKIEKVFNTLHKSELCPMYGRHHNPCMEYTTTHVWDAPEPMCGIHYNPCMEYTISIKNFAPLLRGASKSQWSCGPQNNAFPGSSFPLNSDSLVQSCCTVNAV